MGGAERLKGKGAWAAAILCFAAAAFLRFAVIGYGTLALFFAAAGALVLLFRHLPPRGRVLLAALTGAGALALSAALVPVIRTAGGDPGAEAEYLIILGAGVNGSTPSLSMVNRLTAARAYLEAHPGCTAVASGGQGGGEDLSEAEAMYRWLTAHGIDGGRVILEDRAASTLQNLQYSFALIPPEGRDSVAVVSSEYHLYRAKYLAARLGYSVACVPARTTLPALKLNYFLREGLGVMYYTVFPPVG